jgi:hypothetical protein
MRAGILNPYLWVLWIKRETSREKEKKEEEESRQVEDIRMLDDIPNNPFENCTLNEYLSMLQNHACDPTVVTNQAGFGSFITNHVIKEKLDMYHKESMVPPKLGDVWELRIYDHLDLPPIEKCEIDLKLVVFSISNAHGRVNNVLVELHMNLVHVDFIIMDIDGKKHSPIILSRHFF